MPGFRIISTSDNTEGETLKNWEYLFMPRSKIDNY